MRLKSSSRLLMGVGVAVGALGSLGLLLGLDPVPLAGWLVNVAMYKLVFIAAGGILFAGAVLGRWANRQQLASATRPDVLAQADSARRAGHALPPAADASPPSQSSEGP